MVTNRLFNKDFILLIVINLFIFLSFQMLIPTLPLYLSHSGVGESLLGLVTGATSFAALAMRPLAGRWLDGHGRRRIFLFSLLGLLFFTGILYLEETAYAVIGARFCYGFAWGACSTASSTIAADMIPRERFGEGMGYFALSVSLALAIAPAMAMTIYHEISFHAVIIVAFFLLTIALLLALQVAYPSFIAKPKKAEKREKLYEPSAYKPACMIFFVAGSMAAITNFIAIFAASKGIESVSLFFVMYAVALFFTRPVSGKLLDRLGFSAIVLPSFLLMIFALGLIALTNQYMMLLFAGFLFGSGFAGAQTAFQSMSVLRAPRHSIGAANATFMTGFDSGIGACAITAGVLAHQFGYTAMYLIFCFALGGMLIFYFLSKNNEKKVDIATDERL